MKKPSTERARRFRAKLAVMNCGRLEVVIGNDVIEQARAQCKRANISMWQLVQDALLARMDVSGNSGTTEASPKAAA